ncbi:MAG: AbrB/MazE/SpoVT family DNA-binding protein [Devosia sp.]|uniref:AbrB/MazE/SpoVT family DNA-binding domain-containing protein n=1 Tax=Devosia sp. TaxID=1871048 RepID=UPI00262D83CA|nr:AbrB/MazE/SpoVT family DNA-binding domain-containing protein [Devosia sp.]MDB5528827.1 AbrB/MazE/SpoVT family DNA-binding protein [Devosia sp.]
MATTPLKRADDRPSTNLPAVRTRLKKAGGSLIMTVPARARDALQLTAGQEVTITVVDDTLVLQAATPVRPKYKLDELLAECDFSLPYSEEERAWIDAGPVGRELL